MISELFVRLIERRNEGCFACHKPGEYPLPTSTSKTRQLAGFGTEVRLVQPMDLCIRWSRWQSEAALTI
jgi:hypothetical protein